LLPKLLRKPRRSALQLKLSEKLKRSALLPKQLRRPDFKKLQVSLKILNEKNRIQ
jgi:hypothetical protein